MSSCPSVQCFLRSLDIVSLQKNLQHLLQSYLKQLAEQELLLVVAKTISESTLAVINAFQYISTCIYPWYPKQGPQSLACTNIKFPNHLQVRHHQPCGRSLFKKVKTMKGELILQPVSIYCYESVIESLQEIDVNTTWIHSLVSVKLGYITSYRKSTLREYNDIYKWNILEMTSSHLMESDFSNYHSAMHCKQILILIGSNCNHFHTHCIQK